MRDLLYFDVEKSASLLSQLEGGLLKEIRDAEDLSTDVKAGAKASLKILQAELGGASAEKLSRVETRVLHHDLLSRIESVLFDQSYAVDINVSLGAETPTVENIRAVVAHRGYVRAEGWAVIEDYDRLAWLVGNFNSVLEVIRQSARHPIEQTEVVQGLRALLANQKAVLDSSRDKGKQAHARAELRRHEKEIERLLDNAVGATHASPIPEWLVAGIKHWVSVFNAGQIHLRLYPFEEVPQFQIVANLKRSAFTDEDLSNTIFAYGTRPNVKLTVFGLVTSMPAQDGAPFDPMQEFASSTGDEQGTVKSVEQGFRTAFNGMESFEALMRYQRWPNIVVYPIAVFRQLYPAT